MKKKTAILLLLLIVTNLLLVLVHAEDDASEEELTVLVIHSYNRDYQWTRDIDKGLEDVFRESGINVNIFYEYMDTKNFPFDDDRENVYAYLDKKYENERFDIVIASDNNAMRYVDSSRLDTFDNVPIIATAINGDISYRSLNRDIAILYEVIDYTRFFKALQTLHPDKTKVQIVFDEITPTSQYVLEDVKSFAFLTGFDVDVISEGNVEEIAKTIDPESILVFGLYFGDNNGNKYKHGEALEYLSTQINQPFYVFWDFLINYGGVGGYVLEAEQFGRVAAKEALTILFDAPKADLRVTSGFKFDYNKVRAFNIDVDKLVVDYKWVNRNDTAFLFQVELVILAIVIFTTLILQVHFWRHSRKRDSALKLIEKELSQGLENKQKNLKWLHTFLNVVYEGRNENLIPVGNVIKFLGEEVGISQENAIFLEYLWVHYQDMFDDEMINFQDESQSINLVLLKQRVEMLLSKIESEVHHDFYISMYHSLIYQYTRYDLKADGGENIVPMEARVLAVGNFIYQHTFGSGYTDKLEYDEVINFINRQSGKWFDPKIVECVLNHQGEIYRLLSQGANLKID